MCIFLIFESQEQTTSKKYGNDGGARVSKCRGRGTNVKTKRTKIGGTRGRAGKRRPSNAITWLN